jgi:hypothetical protein
MKNEEMVISLVEAVHDIAKIKGENEALRNENKFLRDTVCKQLTIPRVSNSALQENTKLIDNMCISYRHDFGLMDKEQQDKLRFECKEWLRAYENNREHCC